MAKSPPRKPKLETWLHAAETPVFVLTSTRKVAFFNSGCEELTGWTADDVVGQICEYASDPEENELAALTNKLCPPPEVFNGEQVDAPAYIVHRDGRSIARVLHFYPLKDEDDRVRSVLAIMTPLEMSPPTTKVSAASRLHAELAALRISLRQQFDIKSLVCRSESMNRVLDQIEIARQSQLALLLTGEKSVGKEHIARIIHYGSDIGIRSFVPLECAKLPAWELQQTLNRLFESLEDETAVAPAILPGTLYLSDVERMPRDSQAMLIERLQPARQQTVLSLRLMAGSTIDLRQAVDDGRLRSDLYYLLTPMQIELPALRRRIDELPLLAQHFLEEQNRGQEKQVGGFDDAVMRQFQEHNWPGNIDELAAVVNEAWTACDSDLVRAEHLPFRFRTGREAQRVGPPVRTNTIPLEEYLAKVEREQIELALQQNRQNKTKAAKQLGLTRPKLYRRMESLGIDDADE